MGVSHTMVSRLGAVFKVVAVVIRQYVCLEELHVADGFFWVQKGSDHVGVAIPACLL